MRKLVIFYILVIAVNQLSSQECLGQITGSVSDAKQQPLPYVHIIVKETALSCQLI